MFPQHVDGNFHRYPSRIIGINKNAEHLTCLGLADLFGKSLDAVVTITPHGEQDRALSGAPAMVDRNPKVIFFNHFAKLITGWKPKDVLGKNCQEFFSDKISIKQLVALTGEQEKLLHGRSCLFMIYRERRPFPLSPTSSPRHGLNTKVIGGMQTFRDCPDNLNNA